MSAADVLAVATPSWKMKGLRSANDLVDSSAAADVVDVDGGFAAIVSDFVAASFAVVVVVVLFVLRRMAIGDRPIC